MDTLLSPETIWLRDRILELEMLCSEALLLDSVKAVVAISEPVHMQKSRSILTPSFSIEDDELSIAYMEDILMNSISPSGNLE